MAFKGAVVQHGDRALTNRLGRLGPWLRLYGVAVSFGFAVVLLDLLDGEVRYADIDDVLRSLQIRELLATGDWFDRTLSFVSMPSAYVSPWSRLVDLPYALIALALRPIVGLDTGLHIAFLLWPAIAMAAFCVAATTIMNALLADVTLQPLPVIAAFFMMILSIWQFTPGRIDHHNMQLLLFMLLLLGLLQWRSTGAVLAGLAAVLSVAVGLELLPLVAIVLAAIALCWIGQRPGSRVFLGCFGATILVAAPTTALVLLGPDGASEVACDAYSAPYIIVLTGYGGIATSAAILVRSRNWTLRLAAIAGAGILLIGFAAFLFPQCLLGPYQMVGPLARSLWLDRVKQEHSFLIYFETSQYAVLAMLAALLLILAVSWSSIRTRWAQGETAPMILFAIAAFSLLLVLIQARFIYFATAFVPLFVPVVLAAFSLRPQVALRSVAAPMVVILVLAIVGSHAVPARVPTYDVIDYMAFDICPAPDTSGLGQLPPGRIMASAPLGLAMAAAGLPAGMTIAGIFFHRAADGIDRIYQALALEDPVARRKALEPFDYVAVCSFPVDASISSAHPFASLSRGEGWPGLTLIPKALRGSLQVFSINHAALR